MTKDEIVKIISEKFDLNKGSIRWISQSPTTVAFMIVPIEIDTKDWLGGFKAIDKKTKEILDIGTNPFTVMEFDEKNGPFVSMDL